MSSMIVTLIGIALIAILAGIALFTLGDGFNNNQAKGDYSKLQNEANQISVATNLYMAENSGRSPENVQILVDENYLKSKPSTLIDTIDIEGEPTGVEWEFGFDNYLTQLISDEEKCAIINETAGGSSEVADIPTCSTDFDPKNPCCTF